ncbi:MAG: outer membrane beta-barrel protein [Bradyrhizobium sp.]|nr:outer membrane beta-barrel protein [Bradyrhizobium sp.]
MMKTLFGATVGLGAIAAATSALAADLQMKKGPYTKAPPAVVATVYDWSGFYVGFNAGGGSSRDCWNLVQNANVVVNPALNREGCSGGGGAAVGGQVGYAFDNILGYIKGGAAVVGDRYDTFTTNTNVMLDRANTTRWGGTIGAGLEYGFAPNWSVGVEYDHIFLGNKNLNFVNAAGAAVMTHRIKRDVDIGLVRLNYKFGPGFGMMR